MQLTKQVRHYTLKFTKFYLEVVKESCKKFNLLK